jgi:hypothetical protein
MKKIIAACFEQIIEFDSKTEYLGYTMDLKKRGIAYQVINIRQDESGRVRIRLRKQYNKNEFPDGKEDYGV